MSLHPIKTKHKAKSTRGYARLRVEKGWDTGEKKPWAPGRFTKTGILAIIVLAVILIPSFAYYQNIYLPSLPSPNSNYDPFTLLWNGTVTGPSNTAPPLSSIISQTSGGSAMGIGAGGQCGGDNSCLVWGVLESPR